MIEFLWIKNIFCVLIISSIHDLWFVLNYFIRLNCLQKKYFCVRQFSIHNYWVIMYNMLYDLFFILVILISFLLIHESWVVFSYNTTYFDSLLFWFHDSSIHNSWMILFMPFINDILINSCLYVGFVFWFSTPIKKMTL